MVLQLLPQLICLVLRLLCDGDEMVMHSKTTRSAMDTEGEKCKKKEKRKDRRTP